MANISKHHLHNHPINNSQANHSSGSVDKFLYYFLPDLIEGSSNLTDVLGSKGATFAEMISMGFPVPPWFYHLF